MTEVKWIVQKLTDELGWVMAGSTVYSHPEDAVEEARRRHECFKRPYRAIGLFELERFMNE